MIVVNMRRSSASALIYQIGGYSLDVDSDNNPVLIDGAMIDCKAYRTVRNWYEAGPEAKSLVRPDRRFFNAESFVLEILPALTGINVPSIPAISDSSRTLYEKACGGITIGVEIFLPSRGKLSRSTISAICGNGFPMLVEAKLVFRTSFGFQLLSLADAMVAEIEHSFHHDHRYVLNFGYTVYDSHDTEYTKGAHFERNDFSFQN